ncbi:MAG: class I SAM-dependent methyltransferase [Nanoarchaeota archaeon]
MDLSKYAKIAKFDSTLVENMEILSSMDQYYSWVGGVLKKYSGKRVLDIGCANGNITNIFMDKEFVMGVDYSKEYITQIKERFKGEKNFKAVHLDITDTKRAILLKKHKFDTIVTMNTFEHIKDDALAFKNSYNILEKGGKFLILVPAMRFLYSILDYEGGHYLRYTKKELAERIKKAGFKIEEVFYINLAGAVGWYFVHVLMKKRIYSKGTFSLYNNLVPLFKFCENIIRPPFGLSVVCIAKKE